MKQAFIFECLKFLLEITPYSTDLIVFKSFVKKAVLSEYFIAMLAL